MGSFDVLLDDERSQSDTFVDEYRMALERTLDDESFRLGDDDDVDGVVTEYRAACATARAAVADLPLAEPG